MYMCIVLEDGSSQSLHAAASGSLNLHDCLSGVQFWRKKILKPVSMAFGEDTDLITALMPESQCKSFSSIKYASTAFCSAGGT